MSVADALPPNTQTVGRAVLASLRRATRPFHDQLESHPAMRRLVEEADPTTYASFLRALQMLCASVAADAPLYLHSMDNRWLDYRPWLTALEADLEELPVPPAGPPLPQNSGPGNFWGRLYVIEGSALGGLVLARRLTASRDLPLRFLERGGASLEQQRWPYVLRCLTLFGDSMPDQAAEMTNSAQMTFLWLGQTLERSLRPQGERS